MTNYRKTCTTFGMIGVLALGGLMGCTHQPSEPPVNHGEKFSDEAQITAFGRMNQAQAAAGAKADGMLYDRHFDGDRLNSLGQTKLDLIVKGTPANQPVAVYMNVPHDTVEAREASVQAFLKNTGLTDSQIALAEGQNPNSGTPSAYNLGTVYKANGTSFDGTPADGSGGAAAK